jgi:hypothetical protein
LSASRRLDALPAMPCGPSEWVILPGFGLCGSGLGKHWFFVCAPGPSRARARSRPSPLPPSSTPPTTHKGSHVSDNDPDTLAREKTKALEGHTPTVIPGAPGWNEKLASDSEAVVKAERAAADGSTDGTEPGADISEDVHILQEHTVKVLHEEAFIDRGVQVPDRAGEDPLTRGSSPL